MAMTSSSGPSYRLASVTRGSVTQTADLGRHRLIRRPGHRQLRGVGQGGIGCGAARPACGCRTNPGAARHDRAEPTDPSRGSRRRQGAADTCRGHRRTAGRHNQFVVGTINVVINIVQRRGFDNARHAKRSDNRVDGDTGDPAPHDTSADLVEQRWIVRHPHRLERGFRCWNWFGRGYARDRKWRISYAGWVLGRMPGSPRRRPRLPRPRASCSTNSRPSIRSWRRHPPT